MTIDYLYNEHIGNNTNKICIVLKVIQLIQSQLITVLQSQRFLESSLIDNEELITIISESLEDPRNKSHDIAYFSIHYKYLTKTTH